MLIILLQMKFPSSLQYELITCIILIFLIYSSPITADGTDQLYIPYPQLQAYRVDKPALFSPDHLRQQALAHHQAGRLGKAKTFYQRVLTQHQKILAKDDPLLAQSYQDMAEISKDRGSYPEAELLYQRALGIRDRTGMDQADLAETLHGLAELYYRQTRDQQAEALYQRALNLRSQRFGPNHLKVAETLNGLAVLYLVQHQYRQAESLLLKAKKIYIKTLGIQSPAVATLINNLGLIDNQQGRLKQAKVHFQQALSIRIQQLPSQHPDIAESLHNLAGLYYDQARYREATALLKRSLSISQRVDINLPLRALSFNLLSTIQTAQWQYKEALASARQATNIYRNRTTHHRSLSLAQGALYERQSVRFLFEHHLQILHHHLDTHAQVSNAQLEEAFELIQLAHASTSDHAITTQGHRDPSRLKMEASSFLTLANTQKLLQSDEALMLYFIGTGRSYLMTVRANQATLLQLDADTKTIQRLVKKIGQSLFDLKPTQLRDIPAFDLNAAYHLYQQLFKPAQATLKGVKHIFIIKDQAFRLIPASLLVTQDKYDNVHRFTQFSAYRSVAWLMRSYAFSNLPSVTAFAILRQLNRLPIATKPFIGFGAPQAAFLPDSEAELQALAQLLGADKNAIFTGKQATETIVKTQPLSDYRVIAFATHARLPEASPLSESALVLSPPVMPSSFDNGLLMASEIEQLKLNADWVILSACNTGIENPLSRSGLVQAFFRAGSRALLVTYWNIQSRMAADLSTRVFQELKHHPEMRRAEALRRTMLRVLEPGNKTWQAHPYFWAPFVYIGAR